MGARRGGRRSGAMRLEEETLDLLAAAAALAAQHLLHRRFQASSSAAGAGLAAEVCSTSGRWGFRCSSRWLGGCRGPWGHAQRSGAAERGARAHWFRLQPKGHVFCERRGTGRRGGGKGGTGGKHREEEEGVMP